MDEIRQSFIEALDKATTPKEVEEVRTKFLGRQGSITLLAKNTDFSKLSAEEKRGFGERFNQLKTFADEAVKQAVARVSSAAKPAGSGLDFTIPGSDRRLGALHPITLVQMELEDLFRGLGFRTLTGFEVETEFANFDSVNIPSDHPARDMQDTFWLKNGMLLRTHTSANQVRSMREHGVPIRAIFPGRCFRYEATDASHENTFYQLEGLMVDRGVSVAHLISVMKSLLSGVFHRDVTVRLRPGFFPFVEPGFELDLRCLFCDGGGCQVCKRSGWVELIPCGLVHPRVLEHGGVDTNVYSGFAFGLGLTRLAMMKFGIPDIRLLNAGDIRFSEQFVAGV